MKTRECQVKRNNLTTSYRRQILDADLGHVCASLTGLVLDLGGERRSRRGCFRPPSRPDLHWLCLNLDATVQPEIQADVQAVPCFDGCADAIVCSEVLEHVLQPNRVITECARLLKPSGRLILSMPFLVHIHADPNDYQRFTASKLTHLLTEAGLNVESVHKQGLYFTVLAEMFKMLVRELRPTLLRWAVGAAILPVLRALIWLENRPCLASSPLISSSTTGFFLIAVRSSCQTTGGEI
jgi:SAM-dependent methyltransferase